MEYCCRDKMLGKCRHMASKSGICEESRCPLNDPEINRRGKDDYKL